MSVLVLGTALAVIILIYAVSRHRWSGRSVPTTAAGSQPLHLISDREERKTSESASRQFVPGTWQTATVDSLTDAVELLDTAEAAGCADLEIHILGNSTFLVRWQ
jgi:hypothetical protein